MIWRKTDKRNVGEGNIRSINYLRNKRHWDGGKVSLEKRKGQRKNWERNDESG